MNFEKTMKNLSLKFAKLQFGATARADFYEELAAFLADDTPLKESLSTIYSQYKLTGTDKSHPVAIFCSELLRSYDLGQTLAKTFSAFVPATEATIINTGFERANTVGSLRAAAYYARNSGELGKLFGTLTYPVSLVVLALFLVAMVGKETLPGYKQIIPLEKWPTSAKYFHDFSMLLIDHWYWVLIGVVAFIFGMMWSVQLWTGPLRDRLSRYPPYSLYRQYTTASLFMALSCILRSGLPLRPAVVSIKKQSKGLAAKHMARIVKSLDAGADPKDAFRTGTPRKEDLKNGYVDPGAWLRMSTYMNRGEFADVIDKVARRSTEEANKRIKQAIGVAFFLALITTGSTLMWTFVSQKYLEGAATQYLKRAR